MLDQVLKLPADCYAQTLCFLLFWANCSMAPVLSHCMQVHISYGVDNLTWRVNSNSPCWTHVEDIHPHYQHVGGHSIRMCTIIGGGYFTSLGTAEVSVQLHVERAGSCSTCCFSLTLLLPPVSCTLVVLDAHVYTSCCLEPMLQRLVDLLVEQQRLGRVRPTVVPNFHVGDDMLNLPRPQPVEEVWSCIFQAPLKSIVCACVALVSITSGPMLIQFQHVHLEDHHVQPWRLLNNTRSWISILHLWCNQFHTILTKHNAQVLQNVLHRLCRVEHHHKAISKQCNTRGVILDQFSSNDSQAAAMRCSPRIRQHPVSNAPLSMSLLSTSS